MESLLHIQLLGILESFINWIIDYGGLYILLLVIFAETGLFVGFFFPGDSLLFAAGVFFDKIANKFIGVPQDTPTHFDWAHMVIILLIMIASILGNIVGYWFGRKTGPLLYERRETWLFKK
ncbi:MAG: DedA family protein, partial [Bacteroidia bacterium]|nr:DedA family protein [Bacteroidia bacterium]